MINHPFVKVKAVAFACLTLMSAVSCVNEEYDMSGDNLDLEVTPFPDGLVFPLGSTDTLKLKDLLKNIDSDLFHTLENGVYAVSFNDSFIIEDELSSFTDLLEIEDVEVSRNINFELNGTDVSDVKVSEMDYSFAYDVSSSFQMPELTLPSVSETFDVAAGLSHLTPDPAQLELTDFPGLSHEMCVMSVDESLHIPSGQVNDVPVPIEDQVLQQYIDTSREFDGTESVHINMELPKGISSVEEILLRPGAKMRVTMELRNSFLLSGNLVPQVDIDLHNVFRLNDEYPDGHIHLDDDFVLSEKNGYRQSVEYSIVSLSMDPGKWKRKDADSPCVLDEDFTIPAVGNILFEDLYTTTRLIENNRKMDIYMEVEFIDLHIDDIVMTVDPVTVSHEDEVSIDLDEVVLPEEVDGIRSVRFTEGSALRIEIQADDLSRIRGLEAVLESLVLTFPDEMRIEGANPYNEVVFKDISLSEGFSERIDVIGIGMLDTADGKVAFSDNIGVSAVAKASGTLHSADLPVNEQDELRLLVTVGSDLVVEDYEVEVRGFEYFFDAEPEDVVVELEEDMLDFGEVLITPEGNPELVIEIDVPEMNMDVVPSYDTGLSIHFPEMFVFKTPLPEEYAYDPAANSITLREYLPERIALPVEKILLVPERDENDGKVYARDEMSVSGGISTGAAVLDKADVEHITAPGMKISARVHIPEMVPSEVAMDRLETRIAEDVDFVVIESNDVPEEIVSISRIELDDTYLNLMVDASSLPELGTDALSIDLIVGFPDMVEVSGADAEGKVRLNGTLDKDGKIEVDPIRIEALALEGVDIQDGIKGVIRLEGTVMLSEASLDVDEWLGKEHQVEFKADIKGMEVAKVTGKIDCKVPSVTESFSLSELVDGIEDVASEADLDFNHAHLVIDVNTNLGVPVDAGIVIVPYYDGTADEAGAVRIPALPVNCAGSASEAAVTRYWLASPGSEDRCPAGYEFVKADMLSLLRDIPERIELRIEVATDPKMECVVEPYADYYLNAEYAFEMPLEFGEEFNLVIKDTIQGVSELVARTLSKDKVKLSGTITNSLPLGFDLSVRMLDDNAEQIPLAEGSGYQKIKPCDREGSAQETELGLMLALAENAGNAGVAAIELIFKATPDGVSGVPVTEDSFIYAEIKAILPEGITLDLGDVGNEN